MNLSRKNLILGILPLLILVWGIVILLLFDPFYSRSIDSEYTYLISGLNCSQLNFNRIGHTDNPGTPLQIYNGIIIQFTHLVSGKGPLIQDVFSRPEYYLNAISLSMLLIQVLVLLGIGWIGLKRAIPSWQLLILQASAFYNDVLMWLFLRATPDRFFIIFVLLFILVYLKYGYRDSSPRKFAINSGIVMACGFAIKFNFLPLLILPLVMIKSNKEKLVYASSGIVSFFLFIAPILNKFDNYFRFVKGMFLNEGTYGGGKPGIINFSEMINNFKENFTMNPELCVLLLILGFLLLYAFLNRKKDDNAQFIWIFTGFLVVIALQLILVSKHFKNYYQAPFFALYALIFFIISIYISRIIKEKKLFVLTSLVLPLLFILLNGFKIKRDFQPILKEKQRREKVLNFAQMQINSSDYWFVEPMWEGAPYKENGIVFGLSYCRHRDDYIPQLMAVNPNIITYEGTSEPVKLWRGTTISLDSVVATGDNIHIYSTPGRNATVLLQMVKDAALRNNLQTSVDTIYSDLEAKNEIIRIKALNTSSRWKPVNAITKNRKLKIEEYIQSIKNTPEWLEKIKKKAIEKKISLDSMILLDAIYMVDSEKK